MERRDASVTTRNGDGGVAEHHVGIGPGHVGWYNGDGGHSDEAEVYTYTVQWAYEEEYTP